jgi:hypothetical protein
MRAVSFRFVVPLFLLCSVQVGLYLSLRELFLPRREQARARMCLAASQIVAAVFFVVFLAASRRGLVLPGRVRAYLAEPVLAIETVSLPLMLMLGIGLSLAQRLPGPKSEPRSLPAPSLPESRRIFLARSALGLVGIAAASTAAGIAEAEEQPLLTRHDIPIRGLHRDLDGLTVLQLSDIHAGTLMTYERMRQIADAARVLKPDVVVYTGDLLDVSASAATPFARAFRDLHGPLGSFAVFGNHDYYAGAKVAERAIRDTGALLLRNSGARIERGRGSLFLGGIDDPTRGSHGVDPYRALRGAAPGEPRILLSHRPALFETCRDAGAQLVLSGHTHGGQFALSRSWSLARFLGPRTMGLYSYPGASLYVHRGMGTVGPVPMRLGSPPEIALLTLRAV